MNTFDSFDFLPLAGTSRLDLLDEIGPGFLPTSGTTRIDLTATRDPWPDLDAFDGAQLGSEGYIATDYPTFLY